MTGIATAILRLKPCVTGIAVRWCNLGGTVGVIVLILGFLFSAYDIWGIIRYTSVSLQFGWMGMVGKVTCSECVVHDAVVHTLLLGSVSSAGSAGSAGNATVET